MPPVIRPFSPSVLNQTPTPAAGAAKPASQARAAQQAFFRQALGDAAPLRTAPAPQAPAVAAPAAAAEPARRTEASAVTGRIRPLPEQKPDRVMRPGSFVDIKI